MLTSVQARANLSPEKEGWLALGCNFGYPFISHTVSVLMEGISYDRSRRELLKSAMSRKDKEACRMFINDWSKRPQYRPRVIVSKFIPGEHFHCIGTKFDSLDDAISHLKQNGYEYEGLVEKFIYSTEGD